MTSTDTRGELSPIRNQEVEHASWCKADHGPARMVDISIKYGDPNPLLLGSLRDLVLDGLAEAGHDVMRVFIPHPGYGPEIYLRSCEVRLHWDLVRQVREALGGVMPSVTPSGSSSVADPAADSWWYDSARRALEWLAQTETPFDAYDLTEMGVPDPDHPNRWGSLFRVAKDEGLITPVGYRESRRPSRSGGVCRVWVGKEKAA